MAWLARSKSRRSRTNSAHAIASSASVVVCGARGAVLTAGNVQRLRGHVGGGLLNKAVPDLTVTDLRQWRDALATKLSAATVRRANRPTPPPEAWHKSDHYRLFKRTVTVAFEEDEASAIITSHAEAGDTADNDPITIYALRHSSIVRQILARVPVRVVAVMHDTSVAMIEKNYPRNGSWPGFPGVSGRYHQPVGAG